MKLLDALQKELKADLHSIALPSIPYVGSMGDYMLHRRLSVQNFGRTFWFTFQEIGNFCSVHSLDISWDHDVAGVMLEGANDVTKRI